MLVPLDIIILRVLMVAGNSMFKQVVSKPPTGVEAACDRVTVKAFYYTAYPKIQSMQRSKACAFVFTPCMSVIFVIYNLPISMLDFPPLFRTTSVLCGQD